MLLVLFGNDIYDVGLDFYLLSRYIYIYNSSLFKTISNPNETNPNSLRSHDLQLVPLVKSLMVE